MKSLSRINFNNIKTVGIRVDFNIPVDEHFIITDNTRLLRARDTINFVKNQNCKILLLSHFGRPKENYDEKFSFQALIDQFSEVLDVNLNLLTYEKFLKNGLSDFINLNHQITLLENIRFFKGEIDNELTFSKLITDQLDLYINEAFSASHRSHSSVNRMPKNITSVPGFNFEKEDLAIKEIKNSTKKKLAIIGGSKVSTKINTLLSLTKSCANIFIGGAMANNFLKFKGIPVSSSLLEDGSEKMIKQIYALAQEKECEIHLPLDVVLDNQDTSTIDKLSSLDNFKILDLSDESLKLLISLIHKSELILWNGPLGKIEDTFFAKGSIELAKLLSGVKVDVIIGGGDTLLAINLAGVSFDKYHFVSTAGGAFLEALEENDLPGIKALSQDL
ncbi:phosphoglycerate kinase [Alphaproteobacteria bacterium]|nr:phosphoglycerate kinase [Alphaproteobacteria bacterium]